MSQHAKLAPSAAHRWVPCPGSVLLCKDYPNEDTEATIEGTAAHELAAAMLQGAYWAANPEVGVTLDMVSYIEIYVKDILERAKDKLLMVEQRVWIEPWTSEPDGFGTADAIIFDPVAGHLEVRDLKYGMVIVEALENEQLMLYALGAKRMMESFGYEVKSVTVAIHQPRREHYDEWSPSLEQLAEFGAYAHSRGIMALDPHILPGENLFPTAKGCEYCPAKNDCPAYLKKVHEIVYEDFKEIDGMPHAVARPVEGELTPGELDMVEAWCAAKRKWIFEQLRAGKKMQAWKLVEGRGGNRKFTDETAVEGLLKKFRFRAGEYKETSLKPLTKIEKLVGKERWKHFVRYVTQSPGQPQMAPMSDKRPAYSPMADTEFDNIEEFK